jgi:hypothetical protein
VANAERANVSATFAWREIERDSFSRSAIDPKCLHARRALRGSQATAIRFARVNKENAMSVGIERHEVVIR